VRVKGFIERIISLYSNRSVMLVGGLGRASYPHQQVYIVALEGYAYMVPHVDEGDTCFLKTITPNRVQGI